MKSQTVADLVVETLINWKVEIIFGIPGYGINGFIDSLRKMRGRIKFILVRHEEAAAFMACAYSKYTAKLGVCVGTSGPGAINLLTGLYDAKLDNTPILAITGNTYSDLMGSGYPQDVNLVNLFSDVSVYNNMIISPEQSEMVTDMACRNALSRRGVSHINIPIDIQQKIVTSNYTLHKVKGHTSRFFNNMILPPKNLIEKAAEILNSGRRIVILVGQGGLGSSEEIETISTKLNAPVIKSLLGKAVLADDHPNCLGGLGMLGTVPAFNAMQGADTLLMVGTTFPYLDFLPRPHSVRGIQIDIKSENLGLRYPVELGMTGDTKATLSLLIPLLNKSKENSFLEQRQKEMRNWNRNMNKMLGENTMPIKPQLVANALSEVLAENAIISVDSGNNTIWAAHYIKIKPGMSFSLSGTLSSMGCGLPYCIAAKLAFPDRQCVALVGDGGFANLMSEFSTAVKNNLPIKVIILKDNSYGLVKWEQSTMLDNSVFGVEFSNIDFCQFANGCGGIGFTIKDPSEIKSTFSKAMEQSKPVIIEAYIDPHEMPPPTK